MKDLIAGLLSPITEVLKAREQRKAATETATAKLQQAKTTGDYNIALSDQEWEAIGQKGLKDTWKDEYVTLSIMSIFNLIVVGGILAAFGYPTLLEGVALSIAALSAAEVDVGLLVTATAFAGLGLSIWRKA